MQIMIEKAKESDLEEVLKLQYEAYQREGELVKDMTIQPLTQTVQEIKEEHKRGIILKAVTNSGKIIGSVRGYEEGGICYIGKLMVHPSFQKKGLGTKLLQYMEREFPLKRKELYTSDQSVKNIHFYQRSGYKEFKRKEVTNGYNYVYLYKE